VNSAFYGRVFSSLGEEEAHSQPVCLQHISMILSMVTFLNIID